MPIGAGRRLFLKTALASLCMAQTPVALSDERSLSALRRWATGSTTLNPPAFGGGRIYFCGDRTLGVIAPDIAEPLWWRPHGFDGAAAFRPRLGGGLMICGGRHWIAAFDRASGETVWHHPAAIQTGVPLVTGDAIYFGDGHEIVARATASGALLWRFAGVPDTLVNYAPAISGGTLLAGSGDGRLYALSAAAGGLRWSIDGRQEWQYLRQLNVDGGILVAGSYKEKLFGIAVADGSRLWSFNAGNFINSHHVAAGSAYLWSPTGWIYAIDTATGAVRWRHQTTDYDNSSGNWASLMAELVAQDGKLYALAMDDVLHVLDLKTGDERLRIRVPARIRHAVLPLAGQGLAFPVAGGDLLVTEYV
jgi:outer membrane protein assembly factor BamB